MRGVPPDVFEVRLDQRVDRDAYVIEIRSRMYDIHLGFELRHRWGDPRELADYAERFIGGTVRSWYECRVETSTGREMVQALLPHWERVLHRRMESMEHEARYRGRDDMHDALRYGMAQRYMYADYAAWAAPKEDPKAKQKARELLIRNLDAGQEKSFKKDGEFRVTGKDGKAYTIKTARSFNVVGPDGTKYCGQLQDTPIEDQMLAQKLLLEHEPEKFFKNANVSPALSGREIQYSIVNDPARWIVNGWNNV